MPRKKIRLLQFVDWLSRLLLAGILGYAAIPKLLDVATFATVIDAYGVLPSFLLLPMAVVLPVMELVLAAGLLAGMVWARLGSLVLFLLFVALLSYALVLGLDIDCGCFGPDDPESAAFHGLREALVRDLLLLVPLMYSLWYSLGGRRR